MRGFLIRWLVNTLALLAVVWVIPGIHVDRWETVAVAALILGLFNAFLRPVIVFLTLPFQIVTLGFSILLVNGLMLYLVSKIVEGFYITSFWSAFWGAILFSLISFLLNLSIDRRGKIHVDFREYRSFDKKNVDIIDVEANVHKDTKNP